MHRLFSIGVRCMHDLKVTLYSPGQGTDMQHARASARPVRIPVRTQNSELRTAACRILISGSVEIPDAN